MHHPIEPTIRTIKETRLAGISCRMSYAKNKTSELWRSFMPRLKEIRLRSSNVLYSLQKYPQGFDFAPGSEFEKWALAPVGGNAELPAGLEYFTIPYGQYAVFYYKGPSGNPHIFTYIFSKWLPGSGYQLDDRPHFEILGKGYKRNLPESEEEIWIPVAVVDTN